MMPDDSARISPTAHYTAYVWFKNGMSHPALASSFGRRLHAALWPMNRAYRLVTGRPNLDAMLLARHRVIDHLLERAVESGAVGQVLEIAAGFSPRGFRFARRFPSLTYVEGDLPAQAAEKRRRLEGANLRGTNHHVVPLDALVDDGPDSLSALARSHLPPGVGTAVITEGLVGYFDRATVTALWTRIARSLAQFPRGLYLSDLNTADDARGLRGARAFRLVLELFARGRVHLHFEDEGDALGALRAAGFSTATLHRVGDHASAVEIPDRDRAHVVRIIEASTNL